MQNEYIDLPINIQDTPEYILEKAEAYKPHEDSNEAVNDVLKNLQSLIKGNQQQLHNFYETAFPAVHKTHFSDKTWPSPSSLEELFDTEYKPGAQTIYQEYSLRMIWNTMKAKKDDAQYLDHIDLCWQTYSSIFQLEWTRVNFSPSMIWDYFDSFLHIYTFHQSRIPAVSSNENYSDQWFGAESTLKILKKMSDCIPTAIPTSPTTKQIFAYYSVVAQAVILTHHQKYQEAINIIKRFSLKEMSIFSKACGSLLTLFFNTATSHFMLEEYNKSAKLLETVAPFYQKNRKYFSKSVISAENLHRIYEKSITLLCINYIFLEEKPKSSIMDSFKNLNIRITKDSKDKISDCFSKMKQQDFNTFNKIFAFVISDYYIPQAHEICCQRFKGLESVTLNTIIQNYKRIEVSKMAKILRISGEEILRKLKSLDAVQQNQSSWDTTIMNPLLRQKKKINVEIDGDIAVFDSQTLDNADSSREWQRYRDQFVWLAQKVKNI